MEPSCGWICNPANGTVDRQVSLCARRFFFDPHVGTSCQKAFLTKSIVAANLLFLVSSKKNSITRSRTHEYTNNPLVIANFATGTLDLNSTNIKLCTYYSLNFVMKAGILNPLTSPSILWTILFVCTRSCKMDEVHLLYCFAFTIA